ncbi:hypothetical protein RJZ56_001219 [Blastomyces dermatitidis]|uniref:Uncharacterized protein n=1 Tax=Ajellomyces dermatitidis (strain ER-3 / ATCC MYA-2586) TaxID=559297 RepID=A0ABP2ENG3_AJEDR|nr:uncharacterized protein BDCG_08234 [Blastomyces dermatitidis ER-3]EEQ84965.2 hypothetical protein BDCG_08234 [Blastomyces dermatitidis ER-3]EQL35731.1 hypothetical protein BDFG_02663 [Blastomyces dermatitidis ATCC 26199]
MATRWPLFRQPAVSTAGERSYACLAYPGLHRIYTRITQARVDRIEGFKFSQAKTSPVFELHYDKSVSTSRSWDCENAPSVVSQPGIAMTGAEQDSVYDIRKRYTKRVK